MNNCDVIFLFIILFVLWIGFIYKIKSDLVGLGFINLLFFFFENFSFFKLDVNGLFFILNLLNLSFV